MEDVDTAPTTLARARDAHGEVVLRRRPPATYELVVNGVFAMDTVDVATEELLATLALERAAAAGGDGRTVLVGGLGLGFTTRRVLADPEVTSVVVAELHGPLVDWTRAGLVPPAAGLLDDPRVQVVVADVRDVVIGSPPASLDAVLLDVDNGPDFLVHDGNGALYDAPFLRLAATRLRPGGVLAVWSASPSPRVRAALEEVLGSCDEVLHLVEREGRTFTYALYLAPAAPAPPTPAV
ncbi:hypothetical protein [Kineosporia sp. A_224]|uniref:spermine/spermidine synthase domain-containing protein n=1 Tax=Kineosporia sp. A_224 TaxID=1962180 RepID=UPI000B4B9BB3|nr:hypothetical protein [Kineosporia sp. A_224]